MKARADVARGEGVTPRRRKLTYLSESERPLTSLLFLLPLLAIYEIGIHFSASRHLHAFSLMQDFFLLFGANGQHLPALAVVGILLTWHIARNDPWRARPVTLLTMGAESLILSVPLIVFGFALARYIPLYSGDGSAWRSLAILSCGAGIYEELVFRLGALTCLHLLLMDFLDLRKWLGMLLMVLISSVAFSLYHYLGSEAFHWRSFAFRSVAGLYFSLVFLMRGFGITAGSHAAYDISVVSLSAIFAR